jgi:hypothetical protein
MPLIVATYVCHTARLQRRTGSARTSLGPIIMPLIVCHAARLQRRTGSARTRSDQYWRMPRGVLASVSAHLKPVDIVKVLAISDNSDISTAHALHLDQNFNKNGGSLKRDRHIRQKQYYLFVYTFDMVCFTFFRSSNF